MTVFGRVFQQQYGLSEGARTSLHRDEHEPDGDEKAQRRLRSIGVPFAGAEVRIGDDEGQSLSVGTAGEILLRTPGNMAIGRAHVCTPVTNAQLVCRLLLEKK